MSIMSYKSYLARIEFDAEDEIFVGRIANIDDIIGFHAHSVKELKAAFHAAVDDYIETCKRFKKPLLKSFKGSFNVRVKPDVHQRAALLATMKGISLNQLVQKAIEKELEAA